MLHNNKTSVFWLLLFFLHTVSTVNFLTPTSLSTYLEAYIADKQKKPKQGRKQTLQMLLLKRLRNKFLTRQKPTTNLNLLSTMTNINLFKRGDWENSRNKTSLAASYWGTFVIIQGKAAPLSSLTEGNAMQAMSKAMIASKTYKAWLDRDIDEKMKTFFPSNK